MNITPLDGWSILPETTFGIVSMIAAAFIILVCITVASLKKGRPRILSIIMIIATIFLSFGQIAASNLSTYGQKNDEIKAYVENQGFTIDEFDTAIYAGEEKIMKVSRDGQDFSCTSYAPTDPEGNIFFVCDSQLGFGRTSLEDLKLQLDKASDRVVAEQEESTQTKAR